MQTWLSASLAGNLPESTSAVHIYPEQCLRRRVPRRAGSRHAGRRQARGQLAPLRGSPTWQDLDQDRSTGFFVGFGGRFAIPID